MATFKKTILSLLISVLLTGLFYALAFTSLFNLPEISFYIPSETEIKLILFISLFLTVFLLIFFLFNLRQDPHAIVQNRLKLLETSLIEQFFEHKEGFDKTRWNLELEQRREEIIIQLKQGIKASKKEMKKINAMIQRTWEKSILASGDTSAQVLKPVTNTSSTGSHGPRPGLLMKAAAVAAVSNVETEKSEAATTAELEEMEIVSPFSSILHDLSRNDIIKTREGIHYINEDALSPKTKSPAPQTLNRDFKELVDSVIS